MKLTYANVTASAALFVALGGTSYAASTLARNSVGTAQIARGAVTSSDVRDRSLRARDFRAGTLPRGAQGERGPQGPPGAPAELDGRFVRGAASVTPIPLLDLPNGGGGTLAGVPGVGTLEVSNCAHLNLVLRYTNRSGAPQRWVLAGSYHGRLNVPADSGSIDDGAAIENTHNDAADIVRLSVAGAHPATFELARSPTPNGRCLLWGQALTHG